MRIILSRKGFDSKYGGVASPILPDGRFLSLPIPSSNGNVTYGDMTFQDIHVGNLVENLTQGNILAGASAHLDPDLCEALIPRADGWIPAFGQVGSAQSHLSGHDIGSGDLFLFFGWFRKVDLVNGVWKYVRGAPDLHVLFGWLWVDKVLQVGTNTRDYARQYPALAKHPHLVGKVTDVRNTIYIGNNAGIFSGFSEQHTLTEPGQSRSVWRMPHWFYPRGRSPLTYHGNPKSWSLLKDGFVRLQSARIGQEFVLNCDEYPEAKGWIAGLLPDVRS